MMQHSRLTASASVSQESRGARTALRRQCRGTGTLSKLAVRRNRSVRAASAALGQAEGARSPLRGIHRAVLAGGLPDCGPQPVQERRGMQVGERQCPAEDERSRHVDCDGPFRQPRLQRTDVLGWLRYPQRNPAQSQSLLLHAIRSQQPLTLRVGSPRTRAPMQSGRGRALPAAPPEAARPPPGLGSGAARTAARARRQTAASTAASA